MNKTQLSGIFLAVVMLCGSIPLGFSEPLRVQIEQGIEPENIQCDNPNHVLVEHTNGNIACVTESTAKRTGWEIIKFNWGTSDVLEESTVKRSDEKQIMHFESIPKANSNSHFSTGGILDPITTYDIPNKITVGETVSINYTMNWNDENGDPLYPQYAESMHKPKNKVQVGLLLPDEFEVLSDDFSIAGAWADYYSPHLLVHYKGEGIAYDDSQIISGSIQIQLTEQMTYQKDEFMLYLHHNVEPFQILSDENGDITLVTASELGSEFVEYLDQNNELRYSISYRIDKDTLLWKGGVKNVLTDSRGLPIHLPDMDSIPDIPNSLHTGSSPVESERVEEKGYIPQHAWDDFAQFLRDKVPNDTTPMKEWLLSENMSEQFANNFLSQYPEFLILDMDFRFSFLPEVQGIEPENIQCDNPNHVLVERTSEKLACVTAKSAMKLGWEIVEKQINSTPSDPQDLSDNVQVPPTEKQSFDKVSSLYDNTSTVLIRSDKPYDPKDFPLNQYSNERAKQRAPAQMPMNAPSNPDKIVRFDSDGNIFQYETALNNNFPISQASPDSSSDGTTTQPRTFIIDQWIPTEIPDGQELKVVTWTGPLEVRGSVYEGLSLSYAPINELYTGQNYTGTLHDIHGISLGGEYLVDPQTEEDIRYYEQSVLNFGFWERDTILGKRALVAEGDDIISTIAINTIDYRFGIGSYRYNVAELTEILESIPALQP